MNDYTRQATEHGLNLLAQTLGGCTSITWPLQNEVVLCQKPANHLGRHTAQTVFGIVDWGQPTGKHLPEVEAGLVDPDDVHDRAKESRDRWETEGLEP